MLFTDFGAFKFEQIFGAAQRVFQRAVCIIKQRRVSQAPLALVFTGPGETVWMDLAAQAMKLVLERGQIEVQFLSKPEDRKIIASRRRLNLAAVRAKERGLIVRNRARPASHRYCRID